MRGHGSARGRFRADASAHRRDCGPCRRCGRQGRTFPGHGRPALLPGFGLSRAVRRGRAGSGVRTGRDRGCGPETRCQVGTGRCGASRRTSKPKTWIVPDVLSKRRVTSEKRVVLPAPFKPSRAVKEPAGTVKLTRSSAIRVPKEWLKPSMRSAGCGHQPRSWSCWGQRPMMSRGVPRSRRGFQHSPPVEVNEAFGAARTGLEALILRWRPARRNVPSLKRARSSIVS